MTKTSNSSPPSKEFRVLVIDDAPAIHDDYRKVLCRPAAEGGAAIADMEAVLFGGGGGVADIIGWEPEQTAFTLDSAYQGREGVDMLRQAITEGRPYAMAFVDMRMPPGWDGVQTIRELWKVDPHLQVVICTAYSDYAPDQISREVGVDGRMLILRKPFEGIEVKQLTRTLCEKWDANRRTDELERLVEQRTADLRKAALTDALTGLPNRLLFTDRLARAIQRGKRDPNFKFAVLFIDSDRFKLINDSLGHEAGDQLLLQIAERLTDCAREIDTISRVSGDAGPAPAPEETAAAGAAGGEKGPMAARLGGDEFTIILENIRCDADAARVAQRLLDAGAKPYVVGGQAVHSTMSIGITTNSLVYDKAEDMLRDADTAMYHAKREGRSRFSMFDQAMHNEALARLTFENDLRTAVTQGQIALHYQPIVEMKGGRLIGFEALARWTHPQRGWVPPVEFIALAEETGAIVPLGFQVLETACRQLAAWQAKWPHLHDLTMSVNLSRKQLGVPNLTERIRQILADTGVSPRNLKLELTENTVMQDAKAALQVLRQIREMDIQLHIDDFGTGYSSLSCLQSVPLTGLKIDRDFIREISSKPGQAAIIRTIINLAHTLNIPLVAEGVETAEQTATLQALGCDQAQGYLFAKPMEVAAAEQYIATHCKPAGAAAA